MATKLILSSPASGKTEACIQQIRDVLHAKPLASVHVVVPDRMQAFAFNRRLAKAGGAIGVRVGTFGDLYTNLLRRADLIVPVASEPVIHRLIMGAIHAVKAQGGLEAYTPIAEMPGFANMLRNTFAELKRALVEPDELIQIASGTSAEMEEIGRLFSAYENRLRRINWTDPEGLNQKAIDALVNDPNLAAEWALLIVDGFDSFNGAQRKALCLLGERISQVWITFPGTVKMEQKPRMAHRRFARALEALRKDVPMTTAALEEVYSLPAALAHLEINLFERNLTQVSGEGSVKMLAARSPSEEAREALRWLKERIVRDQLKAHECAVITPNEELYRPLLREAANEFGLSLRFISGEPLNAAPCIGALLSLIELPLKGFRRRSVIDIIRSPYIDLTDFGLEQKDAAALEAASYYGQVVEGMDQWEEVLSRLIDWKAHEGGERSEERISEAIPQGRKAKRLLDGLKSMAERLELARKQSTRSWICWLEDLMDDVHYFDLVETLRNQEATLRLRENLRDLVAMLRLRETLRAMVLGETIAGGSELNAAGFLATLRAALEGVDYKERGRWTDPQVQVLGIYSARGLRFRATAVLGLSEALFPQVEREDPFLSEEFRERIGLESRLGRDQASLFYQAATRSDRFMMLTRPYLAKDGEHWEPSPFWNAAKDLLTDAPKKVRPDAPCPLEEAASYQELLFWGVRRGGMPSRFINGAGQRWKQLQRARDVILSRQDKKSMSMFEGMTPGLAESLSGRYGPKHIWSPSRLESYGTCPMGFYVANALKLEAREPPKYGFDIRQLGTMLHVILEKAYRQTEDRADPEAVLATLRKIAKREFEKAPEFYAFRPNALWKVEQEQFLAALEKSVLGLAELGQEWTATKFEERFGMKGKPVLEMDIGGERIKLRGMIDRLDRNPAGELRVIDYKAGSGHLNARDLILGRRLQLPLYALAASKALGLGPPVDGLYWAILAAKPSQLRLKDFNCRANGNEYHGVEGAIALTREHVSKIVNRVRAGEFRPIPPSGGCPAYCPAAAWCWRYQPSNW